MKIKLLKKNIDRVRCQRGAALVTVLLIATLATIMAVSLATSQQIDIRRTANMINSDQAMLYAQSVEAWGVQVLIRDGLGGTDNFSEDWAVGIPLTEVEGGAVSGYMEDMQSRFNINNIARDSLYEKIARKQLENLLEECDIYLDVIDDVVEWIDPDTMASSGGAEDDYYLSLETGYRTANKLIKDVSELRMIRGMEREGYECLYPKITALPGATPINVNTVSGEVLAALDSNLDRDKVEELVEKRPSEGYASVEDFYAEANKLGLNFKAIENIEGYLEVQSLYFTAHATGMVGRDRPMTINLDCLLYQDSQSNRVTVLSRTITR